MNFPPFWAKGVSGDWACWRWSAQSLADAQAQADQAAQALADRFRCKDDFSRARGGYYPDRPPRELVLREFKNPAGELAAVVTRNSYGCQVLNTARVMFVDIDLPEPAPPPGLMRRLFGSPLPRSQSNPLAAAMTKIENWTRSHQDWGWRVYRTRAGLRLLATQALIAPEAKETDEVFAALDADPLYQKLCRTQKCFRARLTPKPWRCGLRRKPQRWPWADAKAEERFQKWEAQYQSLAFNWATCEFIRHIGEPRVHPEIQPFVDFHDEATRANSKMKLA